MNRRVLAVLSLLALLALAGCTGGAVSDRQLQENATYDWNTDADVAVDVGDRTYQAVVDVDGQDSIDVYHEDGFTGRRPLPISALQYQYTNGTVVGADHISVEETNDEVVVTPPSSGGKLAFTAPSGSKSFRMPVFVEGSYEVVLPAGMRVGVFGLSDVRPAGYETQLTNDRVHITWDSLAEGDIAVRFYLQRDLYLFGGGIAVLALLAVAGVVYYRLQIRKLERQRAEAGLDLEDSDDSEGPGLL